MRTCSTNSSIPSPVAALKRAVLGGGCIQLSNTRYSSMRAAVAAASPPQRSAWLNPRRSGGRVIRRRLRVVSCTSSSAIERSSSPGMLLMSTSHNTTSASAIVRAATCTIYSPSRWSGRWMPGVSRKRIWTFSAVKMPRSASRVVCGLGLVIAIFCPSTRLKSVDLPTLGRPITATNPLRWSGPAGGRSGDSASARVGSMGCIGFFLAHKRTMFTVWQREGDPFNAAELIGAAKGWRAGASQNARSNDADRGLG